MSAALPAVQSVSESEPVTGAVSGASSVVSERDTTAAIALLLEGLLNEREFGALTGIAATDLPQRLANPATLAEVQRVSLEMRNSGALARLEAARHARQAVEVAAEIMGNDEVHTSVRLNAAAYIAKVAGTDKATADEAHKPDRVRIVINLGNEQEAKELVIEGAAAARDIGDAGST